MISYLLSFQVDGSSSSSGGHNKSGGSGNTSMLQRKKSHGSSSSTTTTFTASLSASPAASANNTPFLYSLEEKMQKQLDALASWANVVLRGGIDLDEVRGGG